MATFFKLATVTVGAGGASSVDFTSIPQTYTDLCVKISARTTNAYFRDSVEIRPNGATTNRSLRFFISQGTSNVSGPQSSLYVEIEGDSSPTANTFGSAEIYIPNYTSSSYKSFAVDAVTENNATSDNTLYMNGGLWSSTAAISSLSLVGGGNFMQYSTATLYGIKKD